MRGRRTNRRRCLRVGAQSGGARRLPLAHRPGKDDGPDLEEGGLLRRLIVGRRGGSNVLMDLGLADRIAWVHGGSSGLGRASAESLAREGAAVAISARNEERLIEVARDIQT